MVEVLRTTITKDQNEVQLLSVEPHSYSFWARLKFLINNTKKAHKNNLDMFCFLKDFVKSFGCKNDRTLLVIGGIHPDEWQAEIIVRKMMDMDSRNRVLYIPCLNPDGDDIGCRMNANGVDLNRNFPAKNWEITDKDRYFGGAEPLSEIESRFVDEVIKEYKPDAILTLHTPYKVVNYDGPAEEVAEKMAELSGYEAQDSIGYETPGSFGTYYGKEQNIPVITLEMDDNDNVDELWEEVKDALYYFINV